MDVNVQYEEYFRNVEEKYLMLEYEKPLMIEYLPAGVKCKARTTDRIWDRGSGKVLTGGGEGVEDSDSFLVWTGAKKQTFQQVFEVGEGTHFAGPTMPVVKRVGGVNVTPKRKYSELENHGFCQVLKPSQAYIESALIASESPTKRIKRNINCSTGTKTFPLKK